ncbi:MAG TPA: anacyclamide/piricyclamide family prenylated cyclic peptide [Kamptonema sp.]|nr:anacyclamide/piricyclamide family prenylated cyclic peptide [Kamptonema sp.]
MTKKNIRPQQVAPVQRETSATSWAGEKGMVPLFGFTHCDKTEDRYFCYQTPFAGDDAE